MKKLLTGILLLAFVATSVFAQIKVSKEAKATFDKTIQIDPKTKKPYDLGGLEVMIGDWWSDKNNVPRSDYEIKQTMWVQWVCDTYNVKVYRDKYTEWGDAPEKIKDIFTSATASDNKCYVLLSRPDSVMSIVDEGLAADLSKVTYVDFKNEIFNQSSLDKIKKGKSFYSFSAGNPGLGHIIYYNKDLIRKAGFDGDFPYELQKLGKWNWKNFELLLSAVTNGDSSGFTGSTADLVRTAVLSNGGAFVTKNNDGTFSNTTTSANVVDAANWVRDINNKYGYQNKTDRWDEYKTAFAEGKVAFLVEKLDMFPSYRDEYKMNIDIGMVNFPVGPKGGKITKVDTNNEMFMIPAAYGTDKVNKIMKAVELFMTLNPLSPDYVMEEDPWFAGVDSRFFKETFPIIEKNTVCTYDNLIPGFNIHEVAWSSIWKGSTVNFKDAYSSKKAEWDILVDQFSIK